MARGDSQKTTLHVLNGFNCFLSIALAAAAIWFYVEVVELTNLRNSSHYQLDYNVYWPQAIPWMFIVLSVFVICVCSCGFNGAKKSSKGLITVYSIFIFVVIVLAIAAAVIALVFADSNSTDKFIKDTVWDVYFQSKNDRQVEDAFGVIERRLHCCGVESPRDYKNWKNEFPPSCCDVYYHGFLSPYAIDCDFTNKLANERHGCSVVASQYARIVIKVFSAVALLIAVICIISLVVALTLSKVLRRDSTPLKVEYATEAKKVLL